MIPKCEITVEMLSHINHEFYFFKREYLIFVHNITGFYRVF